MKKIQLYIDEDASRSSFINALRLNNIDCVTTAEANNLGNDDQQQLNWATDNNRVIYTFNVGDFCKLHQIYIEGEKIHQGIIVAERQSYSIGQQLDAINTIIKQLSQEEIKNQLIFLGNYLNKI